MVDENYCIAFRFGKHHFDGGKSGGLLELIVNQSLVIRVIPNFENDEFQYPPEREKLEFLHELERDFKSKREHRYYQFYTADVIFYVDAEKKGKIETLDFSHLKANIENRTVVYFIDEATYAELVYEVRDKFPFFPSEKRRGGKIWKNSILKSKTIKLLDAILPQLISLLDPQKKEILEGKYRNIQIG